jgi:hypothetical protein
MRIHPFAPWAVAAAALAAAPVQLAAHFKLVEPASWIVENERGDPQKSTPCGVTADAKMNGKGPRSVWGVIQSPPQLPVLADGLFPHYTRPASTQTYEADIPIPNISCPKCTLQVIQFMADHAYNQPGGYSYHHCADLAISADPAKPIDKGWPAAATTAAR